MNPDNTVPRTSLVPIIAALAGTVFVLWRVFAERHGDWRPLALVLVGLAIGATLMATNFGFSSAFRRAVTSRDLTTFRAHVLMLALGSAIMVPIIAGGTIFGFPVGGFAPPVGVGFLLGSMLFGMGMQMAGGCASGTLFLLAGGDAKYLFTLAFFIAGSALGAAHASLWHSLPAFPPMTVFSLGPWPILLLAEILALLAAWRWMPRAGMPSRALMTGAVGLVVLNVATLVIVGHPWSETFGFALWGSKIAAFIGFQPKTWGFWGDGSALDASIFADTTSIMDIAIILGATLAAGITRRFMPTFGGSWQSWLSAAMGGLLMGYGARMADGCNIGAYFSAIISGSFSGYAWAAMAIVGSVLGVQARRLLEGMGRSRKMVEA